MDTNELIERLARNAAPTRPLLRPSVRAALWLLGTALYLGVLTAAMASEVALPANLTRLLLGEPFAAAITATAAAAAAFASVVPGYSRRVLVLPLVPAVWWFGLIATRALYEWPAGAATPLAATHEWVCVAMIVMGGILPALGILLMLRRGAPLTPRSTSVLAVLAAAALANVGACLSFRHPSSLVLLTWHGGTIVTLLVLASLAGRTLLRWKTAPPHRATLV